MKLWRWFLRQSVREVILYARQLAVLLNTSLFFLMFLLFFPLTLKPDMNLMQAIAPGLIWFALLLSMLLSADRLFRQEYESGVIEQWLVSGYSLPLLLSLKILIFWFLNLLPFLILTPVVGLIFNLSWSALGVLVLSLLVGTPALFYLCALAAVFGQSVNQQFALLALIFLPLTLPVIIFGASALQLVMQGYAVKGNLALLSAFSLLAAALLPFAIAGVVRVSLND